MNGGIAPSLPGGSSARQTADKETPAVELNFCSPRRPGGNDSAPANYFATGVSNRTVFTQMFFSFLI